ncbi:MAG: hypothetical protein BHW10_05870 [Clostridium sp. CAG:307_30_263]|nr:MAG: hypothetical protein BHW10_05870 [Clostridium sp. CAG:307_30_263]
MDFDDIINEFHLNLNKYISSLTDKDQCNLLDFNQTKIYKETMIKLNSFSNIFDDTNQKIVHTLKEYRNNLEEIQEKLNSSKNMYYQVLHYNIDSITDDLNNKSKDLTEANEILNNQDFRLVTKNRDILNNIDIDKNLINLGYTSYSPDITKHYNIAKDEFAKQCNDNNNINHAKISKEIYIINDMHTKELEQFDFQLQTSKQSILNLTDEITSRKKRNDSLIYKKEVELNQKINEISAKYAEIRKLNEIQSKIELDALKNSINIITEKYNKIKQNLSLELQDLFQVIDDDIDKITLKYNAKMEQFYQEQALERFYKEKKYNNALKLIKSNSESLHHQGYKRKLKREYNTFLLFDKNKKIDVTFYETEYKHKINYLKARKYLLDSQRKYKLALIELDEEYEKYVASLEIDFARNENERYNAKLDNNLSKEVNNERLIFDINKAKIINSLQIWENLRNQSMSFLKLKAKNQANYKMHSIEVNKMNNEIHKQIDENKRKLNDLKAILNIEKNKYLVKYNNELINHKIQLCNNEHSFLKANSTSLFEKNLNTLNEDKQFNESSRQYYIKHSDLIKKQETNTYLDNIEKLNNETHLGRINQKNNLNLKKLNYDNSLLQILLKIISDIEKNYKNIILDMVLSTSNYLKNHLTNCEAYVKVLNAIINEFLHFIITLNDNLLSLICKVINDRVAFEAGNKYDKEITLINEKYNKQTESINDNYIKALKTLSDYDRQLTEIYARLSANDELIKDTSIAEKHKIKEQSKVLIKNSNKIINMSNNVNEAKIKLEYKLKRIEALKKLELDKINTIKNADFIINNQTIIKANMLIDKINSNLNNANNIFKFDLLVIYKDFNKNYIKLKNILNSNLENLYPKMMNIISNFYFNEAKSINLVFKNDVQRNQAIEHDRKKRSEKNIHDLERKIITNNENYRFESERHTCRLNDIELNYLAKLNANESRFKAINKETHSSLMKNKQKYFDIFNACDQNSNHIISTIIKDNTNMKRNFAINLNLLEKKYSLIEKDNIKKQEDYVLKLKKEKILLAKLAKQNEETIKNDYAQKNQSLDQKNSNYDNESLFQKKKKAELIEGYQKNLKKLKEKEKIIYQLERRNIIRKKN